MRTLFTHGTIVPMDGTATALAMLVEDGRILAVADDLRPGDGTHVIDLHGHTVVPAFADCHTHLTFTGCQVVDGSLAGCRSVAELSDVLLQAVRAQPAGGIVRRWNLDDARFADRRPVQADLDAVSRAVPIVLSRVGNGASLLNSAAMSAIGLDRTVPTVEMRDGERTGWTWGEANHEALEFAVLSLTDAEIAAVARAAADLAVQEGVTTLHAIEGSFAGQAAGDRGRSNQWLERLLPVLGDLPITVVPLDSQLDSPADLARIAANGHKVAGGDLFLDGVLGAAYISGMARAALDDPYADGQGGSGHLLLDDATVTSFLMEAARHGVSLGAHAVGERAIAQFLDAWERVVDAEPEARRLRPRIDHGILPREADIDRAGSLGVLFSLQPVFERRSGGPSGQYAGRIGPARSRRTHRFRSLLRAGVTLVGGSDSPMNRIAPLEGIGAAVDHSVESERLTPLEALAMFTTGAAKAGGLEQERGTLSPGKLADFVVLTGDPLDPRQLEACRVRETWRLGRKLWVSAAPRAPLI
ncbi:MAG: amidohydrolase family protein [Chloroflexia bacterium]|nr:amidohydrolase family protein [Chloroflexia bacterium]